MSKDTSSGRGKDFEKSLFEKGQNNGKHQASKEAAETTKIGLRSVQGMLKNWKNSGKHHL